MKNLSSYFKRFAIVAVVLYIVLPAIFGVGYIAGASEVSAKMVQIVPQECDYLFTIVSDDQIPLSATPELGTQGNVGLIVLVITALVLTTAYCIWYAMERLHISDMRSMLSENEAERMFGEMGFFHPIRMRDNIRHAEEYIESRCLAFMV